MHNTKPIQELQLQLALLGYPAWRARRILREAQEHYDDLLRSVRAGGLAEEAAVEEAAKLFGDPKLLAEKHTAALRKSTFLGRRSPVFILVIYSLVFGFVMYWTAMMASMLPVVFWVEFFDSGHQEKIGAAYPAIYVVANLLQGISLLWFGRVLQNAGVTPKMKLMAYGVVTYGAMSSLWFLPFEIFAGDSLRHAGVGSWWLWRTLIPHWSYADTAAIPFLVGMLMYLWHRRTVAKISQKVQYA